MGYFASFCILSLMYLHVSIFEFKCLNLCWVEGWILVDICWTLKLRVSSRYRSDVVEEFWSLIRFSTDLHLGGSWWKIWVWFWFRRLWFDADSEWIFSGNSRTNFFWGGKYVIPRNFLRLKFYGRNFFVFKWNFFELCNEGKYILLIYKIWNDQIFVEFID